MMTTEIEERQFFSLNARYNIAADASPNALLDDASCLLSSLEDLISTLATGMSDKEGEMVANPWSIGSVLYGAQYSVQMIRCVVEAANAKVMRQRRHADE